MTDKLPASIERVITMSRNRAREAGAYSVERLTKEGFVLCIRQGEKVIATAGVAATQEQILGLAAAPAMARALKALLAAVTPEERMAAQGKATAALFAAGVEVK
jgi:hypothetical protein